jgi:2-polyprenyl-6-methoxyphenol hydroxylase-like FAD-dependent oxidoreductase
VHIWPHHSGVVIASPEAEANGAAGGGLDAAVILPLVGPGWSFEALDNVSGAVEAFFREVLPDLLELDTAVVELDADRADHADNNDTSAAGAAAAAAPDAASAAQQQRQRQRHDRRRRRSREGVVSQFQSSPVENFASNSLSPMHHEGKLVFIGDSCHTMSGFWGQGGMNMALEDAQVLSDLLQAAEQAGGQGGQAAVTAGGQQNNGSSAAAASSAGAAVVRRALEAYTARRAGDGAAIVRMSGRHFRRYCEEEGAAAGSSWLAWRQSYQSWMRWLFPAYYYPLLGEMVHFSDLEYAQIERIEEAAQRSSWGIGAL